MTVDELLKIKPDMPSTETVEKAIQKWNSVAKPIGGLGELEKIITHIAGIHGKEEFDLDRRALVIMIADNGIVDEGVSQSESDVTLKVAKLMTEDKSSVGEMIHGIAVSSGSYIDTFPVDIGIKNGTPIGGRIINAKIRAGSRNFMMEPAMNLRETMKAVETGISIVGRLAEEGYDIIATGEMGIGNTTTCSALLAELLRLPVETLTGHGAGLSEEGYAYKCDVIKRALAKYDLNEDIFSLSVKLKEADPDAFEGDIPDMQMINKLHALAALTTFGGYDIAGLAGVFIGGAIHHMPIVMDGVISVTAAYVAEKMVPGVKEYVIPSHLGSEPAMREVFEEMGLTLKPVIRAGLHLGEGTGAVMLFPMLDMAMSLYKSGSTFSELKMDPYKKFTE